MAFLQRPYLQARWQWQPTLTSHDPDPPLKLLTPDGAVTVGGHLDGTSTIKARALVFEIDTGYPIAGGQDSGTSATVNISTTATTGTLIAVALAWFTDGSGSIDPVSVSGAGLTWTKSYEKVLTGTYAGAAVCAIWTAPRGSVDLTGATITVTRSATMTNNTLAAAVYSFRNASTTVGNSAGYEAEATTTVHASVTTTAGSIVIGGWGSGNLATEMTLESGVVRDRTGTNAGAVSRTNVGRITATSGTTVIGSSDSRDYSICAGLEIKVYTTGGTPVVVGVHIDGTSAVGASAHGASSVGSHVEGTTAVSASGHGASAVGSHLDGTSAMSAKALAAVKVGGSLPGTSAVSGSGHGASSVGAHLDGSSAVSASGHGAAGVGSHLDGTSEVSASYKADASVTIGVHIEATSSANASGHGASSAGASLPATSSVSAKPLAAVKVSGHMEGTSSASASGHGSASVGVHLEGTSAASGSAHGQAIGTGHLESASEISASAKVATPALVGVHLEAVSSISANVQDRQIVDVYFPIDGGFSTSRRSEYRPLPKQPQPATVGTQLTAVASLADARARAQARAGGIIHGRSSLSVGAIGYSGPTEEELIAMVLLIHNQAA